MESIISLDRIRGMFMGVFLGDALGIPHEFRCNAKTPYTGKLEFRGFHISQYQGKKEFEVGQVSDDSEMTLTLLRTLIKDNGYVKNNMIMSYMAWANSEGLYSIGKNTRALLKGIKTLKGYQNRIAKILLLPENEISQSNGSLMRVSPLSLLKDDICLIEDCDITNPNKVNRDCNLVYVKSLRLALQGKDRDTIFQNAKNIAQTDEVKTVLQQVENREHRDIINKKGFVLHGIYCTFMVLTSFNDFSDAMAWIINQRGCDSDTLACIAGGLLGAVLGFEQVKSEPLTKENIEILLNADILSGPCPRPEFYQPKDFYELTEAAHKLTLL